MTLIAQVVKWEIQFFILVLAGIVVIKLMVGEINAAGLLFGRTSGGQKDKQYFSPARVQLLVFTLSTAFYYLTLVLNNPYPGTFPPVPEGWPLILGGSNALHIGAKAWAQLGH